jgi:hypothetical protein
MKLSTPVFGLGEISASHSRETRRGMPRRLVLFILITQVFGRGC